MSAQATARRRADTTIFVIPKEASLLIDHGLLDQGSMRSLTMSAGPGHRADLATLLSFGPDAPA